MNYLISCKQVAGRQVSDRNLAQIYIKWRRILNLIKLRRVLKLWNMSASGGLGITFTTLLLLSVIMMPTLKMAQALNQTTAPTSPVAKLLAAAAASKNNNSTHKTTIAPTRMPRNGIEPQIAEDSQIRTIYVESTPYNDLEEPMMNQTTAQRLRRELTNNPDDIWPRKPRATNDSLRLTTTTTTSTTTTTRPPPVALLPPATTSRKPVAETLSSGANSNASDSSDAYAKAYKVLHRSRVYTKKVKNNRKLLGNKAAILAPAAVKDQATNLTEAASHTHEDWVNYDEPDEHMTTEQVQQGDGPGSSAQQAEEISEKLLQKQPTTTKSFSNPHTKVVPQESSPTVGASDNPPVHSASELPGDHVVVRKESSSDEDEHPLVSKSSTTTTTIGDGKKKAKVISKSAALPPGLRQRIIEQFVKSGGNPQNIVVSDSTITTTSQSKKKTITTVYKVVPNSRRLVPAKISIGSSGISKGPATPPGSPKGPRGGELVIDFNMDKLLAPMPQMLLSLPPSSLPKQPNMMEFTPTVNPGRKFKKIMVTRIEMPRQAGQKPQLISEPDIDGNSNNKGSAFNEILSDEKGSSQDFGGLLHMISQDMIFNRPEEFNFPSPGKKNNNQQAPMSLPIQNHGGMQHQSQPKQPMYKIQLIGGTADAGESEDLASQMMKQMKGMKQQPGGGGISLNALMEVLRSMNVANQRSRGKPAKFAFMSHQEMAPLTPTPLPEMPTGSTGKTLEGAFDGGDLGHQQKGQFSSGPMKHLINFSQATGGHQRQPMSKKPSDNAPVSHADGSGGGESPGSRQQPPPAAPKKNLDDDDDESGDSDANADIDDDELTTKSQRELRPPTGSGAAQINTEGTRGVKSAISGANSQETEMQGQGNQSTQPPDQQQADQVRTGQEGADEKLDTLVVDELKRVRLAGGQTAATQRPTSEGSKSQSARDNSSLKKWNTSGVEWNDSANFRQVEADKPTSQANGNQEMAARSRSRLGAKLPSPVGTKNHSRLNNATAHGGGGVKLGKESSVGPIKAFDPSVKSGKPIGKTHNIMMLIDFSPTTSSTQSAPVKAKLANAKEHNSSRQTNRRDLLQRQPQQPATTPASSAVAQQSTISKQNQPISASATRLPLPRAHSSSSYPPQQVTTGSSSPEQSLTPRDEAYRWPLEPEAHQWRPLEDNGARLNVASSGHVHQSSEAHHLAEQSGADFDEEQLGHEPPSIAQEAPLPVPEMSSVDEYGDSTDEEHSSRQQLLLASSQPGSMETMLFDSAAASHQHNYKRPRLPTNGYTYHHQTAPYLVGPAPEAAPYLYSAGPSPAELHHHHSNPLFEQHPSADTVQQQVQHTHNHRRRHLLPEESAKTNQLVNRVIDELAMSNSGEIPGQRQQQAATTTIARGSSTGAPNATGRLLSSATSVHDSTSSITEDEDLTEISAHNLEHNFDLRRRDISA